MITSRIIGGLGNQMFQYAVGRRLSLHLGVPFSIDISAYKTYPLAHYELDHFAIQAAIATDQQAFKAKVDRLIPIPFAKKIAQHVLQAPQYIRENGMPFDRTVLDLPDNVYLDGYWQTEKYFADIIPQIRQDFTFVDNFTGKNKELLAEISAQPNAVMVHVRRGDYVTNKTFNSILGTCSLEYYQEGIKQVAAKTKQPHFYVFSNDAPWTKENLKIDFPTTYVTHNDSSQPQADMRLMAACKHFIVANSTFSWWSAWLSAHPSKIVVAPKRWFNDPSYNAKDLVPVSWLRI